MTDASGSVLVALCCLFLVVMVSSATVVAAVDDGTGSVVQQAGSSDNVTTETRVGGDGTDRVRAVIQTADGGYLLAGQTDSFGDDTDAWLVRLEPDGTERWNRTYGGPGFETFRDLQATDDGRYVAVGSTRSTLDGSSDVYAVKFDGQGNVAWDETYGGPRYDDARAIITDGDGYTLAGVTRSRGSGGLSGWVLHVDTEGTPIWNRTYGGTDDDALNDLNRAGDGYVVVGATASGTTDVAGWALHIGPDGQERWERSLTGGDSTTAAAVAPLNDTDGYILVGERTPDGGGASDAWATRVDGGGTPVWNQTYGENGLDTAVDLIATGDGLAFTGLTTTSDGTQDPWLVGLDRDGQQQSATVAETDGRERIRALDGTSRQFAVVGSTEGSNADGVFLAVEQDTSTDGGDTDPSGNDGGDTGSDGSDGGDAGSGGSDGGDAEPGGSDSDNTGSGVSDGDDPDTGGGDGGDTGSDGGDDSGSEESDISTPTAEPATGAAPLFVTGLVLAVVVGLLLARYLKRD